MRATTLPAVAASLVLLLGACNGGDDETTADDPATTEALSSEEVVELVAEAATATRETGSARVTMAVDQPGAGAGGEGTDTLDILEDFARDRRAISGERSDPGEPEIVLDGRSAHVRQPAEGDDDEPGWYRFELGALADDGLPLEGIPDGFPFRESRHVLEVLAAGEGRGAEVDGAVGRHRVAVDLTAPYDDAGSGTDRWVQRTAERTGEDELVIEVELADEQLREASYEVVTDDGELVVTVTWADLGTEVDIAVPEGDGARDVVPDQLRAVLPGTPLGVPTETTDDQDEPVDGGDTDDEAPEEGADDAPTEDGEG
jgi:hypothetical protein